MTEERHGGATAGKEECLVMCAGQVSLCEFAQVRKVEAAVETFYLENVSRSMTFGERFVPLFVMWLMKLIEASRESLRNVVLM
jgi:hypothetical protein